MQPCKVKGIEGYPVGVARMGNTIAINVGQKSPLWVRAITEKGDEGNLALLRILLSIESGDEDTIAAIAQLEKIMSGDFELDPSVPVDLQEDAPLPS